MSDILVKVATNAPDKEILSTNQLSNRFMLLWSSLDAAGAHAESCAAVFFSAWCAIECVPRSSQKTNDEGDLIADKFLLIHEIMHDNRSKEIVDLGVFSPILSRLTRVDVEYRNKLDGQSSQHGRTLSCGNALTRVMSNTLLGKVIAAASTSVSEDDAMWEVRLSKLLDCTVWDQSVREKSAWGSEIYS